MAGGQAFRATDNILNGRNVTTGLFQPGDMLRDALMGFISSKINLGLDKALARVPLPFRATATVISNVVAGQALKATGNVVAGQPLTEGLFSPDDILMDAASSIWQYRGTYAAGCAQQPLCRATATTGRRRQSMCRCPTNRCGQAPTGHRAPNRVLPRASPIALAPTPSLPHRRRRADQQIDSGDHVLAYDQATGTTGSYTVTAVLVHTDTTQVHLTIDGEQIETTPEHPFFTQGRGWVDASDLRAGDHVRRADGSTGQVQVIEVEQQAQVMYNLTVAVAHTFFVGEGEWLVHGETGKTLPGREWQYKDHIENSSAGLVGHLQNA